MIIGNHMRRGIGNNSHVLYLVQSDTMNGSAVFTDTSKGGTTHVLTAFAGAQHSTTQVKFGKTSILKPNIAAVTTPDHTDFTLSTYDFSMEMWYRPDDVLAGTRAGLGQSGIGQISAYILQSGNKMGYAISANGSGVSQRLSTDTITANTWHHVVFAKCGGTFMFWLDGVRQTAMDITTATPRHDSTELFRIGPSTRGYIDEVRFLKHLCPYPLGGFTLPNRMN